LNTLNNEQIESMTNRLQNWESFDNVMQELAQNNDELKELLEKEKEWKNSNHGVEHDWDKNYWNEIKEKNNQYYIDDDEYMPGKKAWTYDLSFYDLKLWYISIKWLTEKEKKNTIGNPEALKNLVDFYKFFKELNLEWIWKYRKELALSMWNRNINLNDNNSISEAELLKFWNSLIKAINKLNIEKTTIPLKTQTLKLSENTGTISWIKNELRKYSWAWSSLSEGQTFDIYWEGRFTAQLRNLGIIWWAYFHTAQLRKLTK
jgi:hypothetical protein